MENRTYWDAQAASDSVNWHIAHTSKDDQEFYESGKKTLTSIVNVDEIKRNGLVLEIGCGKSRMLNAIHCIRKDVKLIGIDVSPVMIRHCYTNFCSAENMFFVVGNGKDLSVFPDETFYYVYTFHVLQHLPRDISRMYVDEARRVLKTGGKCSIHLKTRRLVETDPADTDFRSIRWYTLQQGRELVGKFTITEERFSDSSDNCYFHLEK